MNINNNLIPVIRKDIITRNDVNGILLFQVSSDEIYFVSKPFFYSVLIKCNGSQTIGEITNEIECDNENVKSYIKKLMTQLFERNIIELW